MTRRPAPIAHCSPDGRVQLLGDHLKGTATLASKFAGEFGAGEWAKITGLWHNLWKYSKRFRLSFGRTNILCKNIRKQMRLT